MKLSIPRLRVAALAGLCMLGLSGTGCAQLLQHAAAASEAAPVPVELTSDEAEVLSETNAYRRANNLPELKPDGRLVAIARQRSKDMASRNYFSHSTPDGENVFMQMREARVTFWAAGENLARNNYPADVAPKEAMEGWEKSAEHRANLLHPAFGHVGIGMARSKDGKRYYTQVFTD